MNEFSVILENLTFKEKLNIIYKCLFKKKICLSLQHNFNTTDMLPDYVKENFCNVCKYKLKAKKAKKRVKRK